MRSGVRVVLVLLTALLLSACSEPDILLADGKFSRFSHWEGRWIIVNYWAEWCAPCRKEIPELNRLHAERNSTGVVVLGVNYDALEGETLANLVEEMDIRFPVLVLDPRLRWNVEQPSVLPTTLFINPDGELHKVVQGPQTYESISRTIGLTTEG
ncbi:MAG: TlpA disulfide reductase family protein [Gammaproteobacteria bacterium]|nr:TlpA disulfide reductase family protein [Gammaproteobacteria bacterium]